jgi:phage FluMu protein Com
MKKLIYKVIYNGETILYAKSKKEASKSLEKSWAYNPSKKERYIIKPVKINAELIIGDLVFLEKKDHPHFVWKCPACNEIHETDLEEETFPLLLMCEKLEKEFFFIGTERNSEKKNPL